MGSALSSNIRDTLEFRVNRSTNILLAVLGKSRRRSAPNEELALGHRAALGLDPTSGRVAKRIVFQISSPHHHSQASIATTAGIMAAPSTIGKRKSQATGMRSDTKATGSVHAVIKAPGSNHHRLGRISGHPPTRSHQTTIAAHWIVRIRTSALRVLPYLFSTTVSKADGCAHG
jgi:hypothetical protein